MKYNALDGDIFNDLIEEDREVANKLVEGLRALIASIKKVLAKFGASLNGKWLEDIGVYEEAQKMWVDALNASIDIEMDYEGSYSGNDVQFAIA